jgi:hypothetical protein
MPSHSLNIFIKDEDIFMATVEAHSGVNHPATHHEQKETTVIEPLLVQLRLIMQAMLQSIDMFF